MYVPLGSSSAQGHLPSMSARYAQIEVWDSGSAPVCIGEFRLFGPDPAAAKMMLGSDLSFTPQELAAGAVFTDNGAPGNPANITAQNGAGWARLRLWVNPPAGYNDLASDLAFAKTIQAAGLKLYLDIHYSDFWADPGLAAVPHGSGLACSTGSRSRSRVSPGHLIPARLARPTTTRPCSTSRGKRCRRSACTAIPSRSASIRTRIQHLASSGLRTHPASSGLRTPGAGGPGHRAGRQ